MVRLWPRRGGNVTGEVEKILVDSSEELRSFKVDIAQPLEVERSPGYEEEKDDTC